MTKLSKWASHTTLMHDMGIYAKMWEKELHMERSFIDFF